MYFGSVSLRNFRNYEKETVTFDKKLNLFLGENAQGKTNLLESLFIMSLGRSFRAVKDSDMILFGKEFAQAKAEIFHEEEGLSEEIEIVITRGGKIIKIDGVKLQKSADLSEHVYTVVFSPEDLRLIKDGSESRRKFLDRELCQLSPVYYGNLINYKKVLRGRNILLKEGDTNFTLLDVYGDALSEYGMEISEARKGFLERLAKISGKIHEKISGGAEELFLKYEGEGLFEGEAPEKREKYKEELNKRLEKDLRFGYTSYGPHKDDFKVTVNGADMRQFGSQGQQRSAALSLKLAEIDLIKEETGKNAVLLLDDVLSELDKTRRRYLIESVKNSQVFITATDIGEEELKLLPKGKSFFVKGGAVGPA